MWEWDKVFSVQPRTRVSGSHLLVFSRRVGISGLAFARILNVEGKIQNGVNSQIHNAEFKMSYDARSREPRTQTDRF